MDLPKESRKLRNKAITFPKKKNIQYYELSIKANYNTHKPLLYLARKLCGADDLFFVSGPALCPPSISLQSSSVAASQLWRNCNVAAADAAGFELPEDCTYMTPWNRRRFNMWNRQKYWKMFITGISKFHTDECLVLGNSGPYAAETMSSTHAANSRIHHIDDLMATTANCVETYSARQSSIYTVLHCFDLTNYITLYL